MNENLIAPCLLGAQTVCNIPITLSESETDTNSEEEFEMMIIISKKRKFLKPQRIENYVERVVPGLTAQEFQRHFRVTVDAYENLLCIVGPYLKRQSALGRCRIEIEKQLLAVIWLLATPDSYRSVGERFDLAKASLSKCFVRVIKALNTVAPRVIKWPEGQNLVEIRQQFYNIARLPNVVGAVDGTYIPIKAPKVDPQSYITRKCHYAYTLQAIADSSLRFTDVFIGYPGSVSDTRIFKNSDIYRHVQHNIGNYFSHNDFIIGDKAYPVLSWCIPPFINRGRLTQAQIYFNKVHAKTRQVVERAFALLFGRFRRLKFLDMNRHDLIPATVLAACVLHNVCLNFADLLIEEYIQEGIHYVIPNEEENNIAHQAEDDGMERRNIICRELFANRRI